MNLALEEKSGFCDDYFHAGAGCEIVKNYFSLLSFKRVIEFAMIGGAYFLKARYLEATWTNAEVTRSFALDKKALNFGRVMATLFVVSAQSERFYAVKQVMKEWRFKSDTNGLVCLPDRPISQLIHFGLVAIRDATCFAVCPYAENCRKKWQPTDVSDSTSTV